MQEIGSKLHATNLKQLTNASQFILGPQFIERLLSWQKMEINNAMYLTVHPYLTVYKTTYQNISVILLGYILDPDKPEARDEHIINDLLLTSSDADELILNTYRLGGRWILIIDDGEELRLLHDAAGLRQVYYSDVHRTKDLWCASQATLIAEILGLQMNNEAVGFINWFNGPNSAPTTKLISL